MTKTLVKPQTPDLPQTHPGYDAAWASYWQEKSRWQEQEIEQLRATQSDWDICLRQSVPERWKALEHPVGAAQAYIAELERRLQSHGEYPLDPPPAEPVDGLLGEVNALRALLADEGYVVGTYTGNGKPLFSRPTEKSGEQP